MWRMLLERCFVLRRSCCGSAVDGAIGGGIVSACAAGLSFWIAPVAAADVFFEATRLCLCRVALTVHSSHHFAKRLSAWLCGHVGHCLFAIGGKDFCPPVVHLLIFLRWDLWDRRWDFLLWHRVRVILNHPATAAGHVGSGLGYAGFC